MTSQMIHQIILIALLTLSLGVQAGKPPLPDTTPPDFPQTQIIGERVNAAEPNIKEWEQKLLGEAANYNAYTKKMSDQALVLKYLNACQGSFFPAGIFGGLIKPKTFECNFAVNHSGNELLVSSLLSPIAYTDDRERNAAMNFVRNLTNIAPISYPGDDVVFKDPKKKDALTDEGIKYFAKMFKQIPSLSVTQNSLLALFADRERLPGMAAGLPKTVGKDGAASLLEIFEYEATRRYTNPDWFKRMDTSSDSATLHEIAYMMAFQNYLMVKSYEQNARIEALMAAQLSSSNSMMNMASQSPSSGEIQESFGQ